MKDKLLRYSLGSDLIIYALRCLIGFGIGYYIYWKFPEKELYWMLISVVLVISPEEKDAKKLAIERFKSNFIGSVIGLFCYFIPVHQVFMMLTGIILSIIVCRLFNILTVARTSMVALIIVLVHEQQQHSYFSAFERFLSVGMGCFIGLMVTLVTSYFINKLRRKLNLVRETDVNTD
ncbi:FUSC family protein [Sphingobacterium spiritivorum]|uniref:FUSC family protein n=1 Tax=Sphingobacterium spiritivorum TaxID=258 RepID=UPI003DA2C2C2